MHNQPVDTLYTQASLIVTYMSLFTNKLVNVLNNTLTHTFFQICNAIGTVCFNLAGKSSKYSK